MAQKIGLFLALGPKSDGVGQGVHGLSVSTDERTAEVYMLDLVLFRLEVCDLANVIAIDCEHLGTQDTWLLQRDIPDSVEKTSAHVPVIETNSVVAVLEILVTNQALTVLRTSLGGILKAKNFAECARDRSALEPNLAVVHAVDVPHEHVHPTVVAAIRHGQHVVESSGAGQQGHQAPEGPTSKVSTAHTLILSRPRHLDHRDTGSNVDQEIRVYVRSSLGILHGLRVRITIREHLVGNFGDEKVQTWY